MVALDDTGLVMGPSFGNAVGQSTVLADSIYSDGYERAYYTDLTRRAMATDASVNLLGLMEHKRNFASSSMELAPGQTMKLSVTKSDTGRYVDEYGRALSDDGSLLPYTSVRASWSSQLGKHTALYSTFSNGLTDNLGFSSEAFTTSHNEAFLNRATNQNAYLSGGGEARRVSISSNIGKNTSFALGVGTVDVEAGSSEFLPANLDPARKSAVVAQLTHHTNRGVWQVETGVVTEENMVLNTRGAGALDFGDEATTGYLGLKGSWTLSPSVEFSMGVRAGVTDIEEADVSLFRDASDVTTFGAEISLTKTGLFQSHDRLSFALAQPIRVEAGQINLDAPVSWSYKSLEAGFESERLNLSPTGREFDMEVSYTTKLESGWNVQANLLHQVEPGHVADAEPQTSLFMHMKLGF